jgi:hypothetical protein
MKKLILIFLTVILNSINSLGQLKQEVVVPKFNDKYCNYVKELEAGRTNMDYQNFRFSFIESDQFKIANRKSVLLDSLVKEMYLQMNESNYEKIIKIAKQILSIDYTRMIAHKILRQTYKITGDTINASKYKTIQFGLLNSIVKKGDGQSCVTAWPVIQVSEEYFILDMINAQLERRSVDYNGGTCDKMEVKVARPVSISEEYINEYNGKEKKMKNTTYYFEVSKVFEGYKKLGIN